MMKQYQNKEWLYDQYIKKKLSIPEIAKLCEVVYSIIWHWLKKLSIPIRSRGEGTHLVNGNHCDLSQKAIEWINGELLGDGCLRSQSPYSAQFIYTSKHLKYIEYVSDTLKSFGIRQSGKIYKSYHKNLDCNTYHYQSHAYKELLSVYKRWYPKRKKIVPKNIKLTPIICRQWHIGDGCLIHRINGGRSRIRLYTNNFTISEVEWLVRELIELGFKATRQIFHNAIGISTHSTKAFLDYIGSCPVECYQYKWNYQDNRRILA